MFSLRGSQIAWWSIFAVQLLPAQSRPVTFYRDISPIIYKNCSVCHRPGESGPFPLLSYNDVKAHARQIAQVTQSHYMPPWLPERGHGEFEEERRLSESQIALIQAWVKQGSLAGNPAQSATVPKFASEWALGKPDMILQAKQPYILGPEGAEIFWNFVMPVPVSGRRWVKAMEVRPGNQQVFHHANVIIDRSGAARRKESQPGSGFGGMDLSVEEDTFDPDGHFLSWKPGSEAIIEPDGMAWRAEPGMDLVLNVHLRRTGKEETVDPEIGLYFTDQPQTKFPMLVQLEHDGALKIPPGEKDFPIGDDFVCPMDLKVLAVYPHAHYLGSLMEAYATLPDGSRKWLVRIPHWDLNWQGVYRLKQPMTLPKGTIVSMRYHYDNSSQNARNPNKPPKLVNAGNEAGDEMSHFWMQVLPVGEGDRRADLQEALMQRRLEKYPGDFAANFNLGDLMISKGKTEQAVEFFTRATQADPHSAIAAGELGAAMFTLSKVPEAKADFRRALELDPRYIDARYNLACVEASDAEWPGAVDDFKEVLHLSPDHVNAKQHLGEVLFLWGESLAKSGDRAQAVTRYSESLAYRPDDADLHMRLGIALAQLGRFQDAKAAVGDALRIHPDSQEAKQLLARITEEASRRGR